MPVVLKLCSVELTGLQNGRESVPAFVSSINISANFCKKSWTCNAAVYNQSSVEPKDFVGVEHRLCINTINSNTSQDLKIRHFSNTSLINVN